MRMTRRTMVAGMVSLTAPALLGSRAKAQNTINLTMSSSHPTTLAWVQPLQTVIVARSNEMLEERGSDHRINWTESYGGALYGFGETLSAITQNLTDMGWIGALWEENDLPLQNIMFRTPFSTQTVHQAVNTMNRLNAEHPAMKAEWERSNITYFGTCVSDSYQLLMKEPIESLDQLRGKRIIGVPTLASWVEPLGASLVPSGLPQMYSQLQTGVGDGVLIIGTGAYPLRLHEQAPYILRLDTGPFCFGGFGINTDVFNSLPEDVQEVLAELGMEYSAENVRIIEDLEPRVFSLFEEEGATVLETPPGLREEYVMGLGDLAGEWVRSLEARGIPARDFLLTYMETLREEGAEPLRDWAADV